MKKKIVRKVFITIFGILMITLLIQLVFQVYIIDDVYRFFKRIELVDAFDRYIHDYEDVNRLTDEFYETYHAPVIVLNQSHEIINDQFIEQFNYLTLENDSGTYRVLIGNRVDERGKLSFGYDHLVVGNEASFTGSHLINKDVVVLDMGQINPLFEEVITVKGTIVETHYFPKQDGVFSYQSRKLLGETGQIIYDNELGRSTTDFLEGSTGLRINVIVREKNDLYYLTLYTTEDLSRTFTVLNNFYIFLFVFQVLLLMGVSFVYTRWFTKPLTTLNDEAKRIADLDFSFNSDIRTGDELEELSNSLNSISKSMSSNMEKLKLDAKEMADNEKRMRELLVNLSHEYKTPLGIISGFLEMMEADEEKKEYYLGTIHEEIDKLNNLTKETLLLCESESYTELKDLTTYSTVEICDVTKFANEIKEKKIHLEINVETMDVMCDKHKIQIVMDNFMSNAIKYTDEGENIIIATEEKDEDVIISVKNTGVHFNEEDMINVWDKYYRIEKSRNKTYGGNGVGLAIVKNILKAHQSRFGVYNDDDGVVFYFELKKYT